MEKSYTIEKYGTGDKILKTSSTVIGTKCQDCGFKPYSEIFGGDFLSFVHTLKLHV